MSRPLRLPSCMSLRVHVACGRMFGQRLTGSFMIKLFLQPVVGTVRDSP